MASTDSTVPLPEIPEKTCYKCRQTFPARPEYFARDKSTKDGLTRRCKRCAKIYADAHTEQALLAARKYQKLHPERCRHAVKKWRDAHREEVNAQARLYRLLYPERVKQSQRTYTKANPAKMAVKNHRQRSRKHALPVHYTAEMWQAACAYFQHTCAVCGREEGFFWLLSQDHWRPLSDPACPGTVASNIVPLCHPKSGPYHSCNTTKMKRDPQTWLIEKLGPRKAREMLTKIETFFAYMRERFPD